MRKIFLLSAFCMFLLSSSFSQLLTAPNGGNKMASVSERIGLSDVSISYNRPGVKGREGKIWGQLVHTGFADQGFGTSKSAPWRAGANENTIIHFSTDVMVEGKPLAAGVYGLFIAYDPNESTIIFSKNSTSWGSFFYDDKEDILRVKVKPVALDKNVEWLRYEFMNETDSSAVIALEWEKLAIPFKVQTDYIKLQLESFRRELRSEKNFSLGWQPFVQAAGFCLQNNVNLDEALTWANHAVSGPFIGEKNFQTLSTKAQILVKQGKTAEADAAMKEALPLGNMGQIHQYARQLLAQKRGQDAFNAFKLNFDKNPNVFTTNMGMTRGYSAVGNYKKALEFAQKALPQAPDKLNKDNVERVIKMLQEGKDIN